jgi:hypothetical protein
MAHAKLGDSSGPLAGNDPAALPIWPTLMFDELLQAQRTQWDAFSAWQQSLLAFSKDFWEQWAVRFAGGVPIDA